jgi:hypothetical protein
MFCSIGCGSKLRPKFKGRERESLYDWPEKAKKNFIIKWNFGKNGFIVTLDCSELSGTRITVR